MNWNKGNSKFLNRIDTINHIVIQHKPDIFSIQEANIHMSDDLDKCQLPGYNLEVDNLLQTKGLARTVTYIQKEIKYRRLPELESKIEPNIWIEIQQKGNQKLRFQNFYRQWQEVSHNGAIPDTKSVPKQTTRFKNLTKIWSEQIELPNTEVISMSDTNLNLSLDYNQPEKLDFHDRKLIHIYRILNENIFNKGASTILTKPTKIHHNKDFTFIDHLITNKPQNIIHSQVLPCGAGDHLIQKYYKTNKTQIHFPSFRLVRDFKLISWSQLKAELLNDPLIQIAQSSQDPDTIATSLIDAITTNLDNQAAIKRIQTNKKTPPFISPATRDVLSLRDQALRKAKETLNDDDIRIFKTLRNRSHKLISADKKSTLSKTFQDAENDPKRLWQVTKESLGWTKSLSPNTISFGGKTIHSPMEIANTINHSHISRNIKLHREIPKSNIDPIKNFQKLVKDKKLNFQLKPISIKELRSQLSQMKPTPSSGIDTISIKTIKQILPAVEKGILNLINTSFSTGIYPQKLKAAKIIPILKPNKPPTNPLSYRGINILSSLAKIIDKAANTQITKYLITNKLLLHEHNGGIAGRSTMSAVTEMLDEWANSLEQGQHIAILALDQSAAFDIVYHPILLKKFEKLGFNTLTMKFFKSYLQNRTQRVMVDSYLSDELNIGPMSVCQGSTLSGLLYLIFTLDYPLIHQSKILPIQNSINCKAPKLTTFVDDSISRIILSENHDQNNESIRNTLTTITEYMNSNQLVINQDKSQLLIITENNTIRNQISLKIDGFEKPIKPQRNMTYLGIEIQDSLKWNYFIQDSKNNLIQALQKRLNAVKIIRNQISFKTTKTLLNGLFHSKLLYGAVLWAGAPNYLKSKIQHMQLNACRAAIGHKSQRWSTLQLLQAMNWSPVSKLLDRSTISMVHDIIHKNEPQVLSFKILHHDLLQPLYDNREKIPLSPVSPNNRRNILQSPPHPNNVPPADQVQRSFPPADQLQRSFPPAIDLTHRNFPPADPNQRSFPPATDQNHRNFPPATENKPTTRLTGPLKIGTRPRNVGRTKITRYHFRANAYNIYGTLPDSITQIKIKKKFLMWVKRFQKDPKNVPKTNLHLIPQNSRI